MGVGGGWELVLAAASYCVGFGLVSLSFLAGNCDHVSRFFSLVAFLCFGLRGGHWFGLSVFIGGVATTLIVYLNYATMASRSGRIFGACQPRLSSQHSSRSAHTWLSLRPA